jgi:DNA-binding PadR family transcriptional regulator
MKNKDEFDLFEEDLGDLIREKVYRNIGRFARSWGDGPRMGHGDVAPSVLRAIKEKPMHGYEIIQHFERKSHGMWRPSPGSIYPILQSLEDQGLVKSQVRSGKKVYELTKKGLAEIEKNPEDHYTSRFEDLADHWRQASVWKQGIHMMVSSIHEIGHRGTSKDTEKAREIIENAAEKLSKLVAEIKNRD